MPSTAAPARRLPPPSLGRPRRRGARRTPTPLAALPPVDALAAGADSSLSSASSTAAAAAAATALFGSGPLEALTSVLGGGSGGGAGSFTLVASAALACFSVGLNLYGGLLIERKRADLQLEVDRERTVAAARAELQSLLARYRGPLLEAAIDLEQRLWHLACFPEEWELSPRALAACDVTTPATSPPQLALAPGCGPDAGLCGDEVNYAAFCVAQFLGFVEVVRREGPRERSFLQRDNGGSDVLATFVESVRFIMCASNDALAFWGATPEAEREHPGARVRRRRRRHTDKGTGYLDSDDEDGGVESSADSAGGDHNAFTARPRSRSPPRSLDVDDAYVFRISRGAQRAIGSFMISTPMGAERHYTLSYGEFCERLGADPAFAARIAPLRADVAALASGPRWGGVGPFPVTRWTRLLLLQQLLVEAMELLDPQGARIPLGRRQPLYPFACALLLDRKEALDFSLELDTLETLPGDALAGLRQVAGGGFSALRRGV